jgi:hypothetical protein
MADAIIPFHRRRKRDYQRLADAASVSSCSYERRWGDVMKQYRKEIALAVALCVWAVALMFAALA